METQLTKNTILKLYKEGNESTKNELLKELGKEFFSADWMELWKKFCKENKLILTLPYPNPAISDEEYIDAHFMMMHIIRTRRKKKPNWNNSNEYKYAPYFDMRSTSGFGFSVSNADYWDADASVGSRLCIPDDEKLVRELAVEFLPIYEKIMTE